MVRGSNAAEVSVRLLGGFEVVVDGRGIRVPVRVQRLTAFLALAPRPLHRAYVAGRLWLDASQVQAYGSLRTTLWAARRLQCPVEASSTHVGLQPGALVDSRELAARAERILGHATPAGGDNVDQLVRAADLLPDWYDDWVIQERDRLHQLRLLALEAATDDLIAAGRYPEAATAALAAVTTEPLRESAFLRLVRVCLAMGNIAEASQRIGVYCTRLQEEFQLEPSPRVRQLLADTATRRPEVFADELRLSGPRRGTPTTTPSGVTALASS
jgi:DNA-binding SARP family transcriptional activator